MNNELSSKPSVWEYFRFVRFPMFLAPVVVFVLGMVQSRGSWPQGLHDEITILAMIFVAAGTFAYNGFEDRGIDMTKGESFAQNHPRNAFVIAFVLYGLGLLSASLLGNFVLALFFCLVVATVFYSRFAVKVVIVKNVAAALLSAVLVLFGGLSVGSITRHNVVVFFVILFAILAMEMMNDVEDREADRGYRTTLPHVAHFTLLRRSIWLCIVLAGVSGTLLWNHTLLFSLLYVLAILAFLGAVFSLPRKLESIVSHRSRLLLYAGLWFGLAAFFAASFSR